MTMRMHGPIVGVATALLMALQVSIAAAGPVILGGDDLTDHGSVQVTPAAGTGTTVNESEANDTFGTANAMAIGDDFTGDVNPAGDSDFVGFAATGGETIVATIVLGTLSDSTLRLLDTDGTTQLDFNDDAIGAASQIAFTLPAVAGTYFLQVESCCPGGSSGTYTLQLRLVSSVTLVDGWLYIQKALQNIMPLVTRTGNDGSIAALGSTPSQAMSGNAGAAIGYAADAVGLPVMYYEGATAINQFFMDLTNANVNPAIIWTAGTGASNDLSSAEGQALTDNAMLIRDFVGSGGGLLSHGSGVDAYGWLTVLIPSITNVSGGSSGDLSLTPAGIAAFPGLTNSEINAGPWHSHFEGDLGGLQVLAQSANITNSQGQPAAVIIGGAQAQLQPQQIPAAPTLSVPGIAALALLLAGVGVYGTRRARKPRTP